MTDREELTVLLMAGAGDCLGKDGTLNCSKFADYLLKHGITVLPRKDAKRSNAIVYYLTREEAEKVLNGEFIEVDSE